MTRLKFVDIIKRDHFQQKDKLFICANTSCNEYEAILQQNDNSSAIKKVRKRSIIISPHK